MPAIKDTSQGEAEDWEFEANTYHIAKCCPKGKRKKEKQRNNKKQNKITTATTKQGQWILGTVT